MQFEISIQDKLNLIQSTDNQILGRRATEGDFKVEVRAHHATYGTEGTINLQETTTISWSQNRILLQYTVKSSLYRVNRISSYYSPNATTVKVSNFSLITLCNNNSEFLSFITNFTKSVFFLLFRCFLMKIQLNGGYTAGVLILLWILLFYKYIKYRIIKVSRFLGSFMKKFYKKSASQGALLSTTWPS